MCYITTGRPTLFIYFWTYRQPDWFLLPEAKASSVPFSVQLKGECTFWFAQFSTPASRTHSLSLRSEEECPPLCLFFFLLPSCALHPWEEECIFQYSWRSKFSWKRGGLERDPASLGIGWGCQKQLQDLAKPPSHSRNQRFPTADLLACFFFLLLFFQRPPIPAAIYAHYWIWQGFLAILTPSDCFCHAAWSDAFGPVYPRQASWSGSSDLSHSLNYNLAA